MIDIEIRRRIAKKTGIHCKAFWLRQSRYLQQVGDDAPVLVPAAPDAPAMVLLEVGTVQVKKRNVHGNLEMDEEGNEVLVERQLVRPDAHLVPVVDPSEPPAAPKKSHMPPNSGRSARRAPDVHSRKAGGQSEGGAPPAPPQGSEPPAAPKV